MIDSMAALQFNENGDLKHLLCLQCFDRDRLQHLLDAADTLIAQQHHRDYQLTDLKGKTIAIFCCEPSTRTRTSFYLAAKRLAAEVVILDPDNASTLKGETLLDTLQTLEAMQVDALVLRHSDPQIAYELAASANRCAIINAGTGIHAHPSQALLDLLTMRQHCQDFRDLSIAILGDLNHSRVARSLLTGLQILGCGDIRLIAPKELLPSDIDAWQVRSFDDIETGIKDVDIVYCLRIQRERIGRDIAFTDSDFFHRFGLTTQRLQLAKANAIVMHPGPINRGIEIAAEVADGPQSRILQQVSNGIAMRMAILQEILL